MANNKKNNNLVDLASKLKNTIVGTKTTQIDQQLDDAVKDITSFRSNINQQNYIELLRNYISNYQSNGVNTSLFSQHGDSSPAALGQGQRLKRYKLYESITSNITYCKRALNVLVDNILAPDDISKESIEVRPESYLEDQEQTESRIKQVRTIIDTLKLESSIHLIVNNTLKFGDYFCEIADNKTALTSRSFLVESELLSKTNNDDNRRKAYEGNGITVNINYDYLFERKNGGNNRNGGNNKKDNDTYKASQLNLVLHNPDRVVKLQSDLYPVCFGYLIFPRYSGHGSFGSYREEQPIDDICAGILSDLQKNIPQASDLHNDDELKDIISTMISQTNTNVMNIRYVPPNRMEHFVVPSSKYHPYGESIFDCVQFDAKVLMSMQSALAIQRLNRSTEKRKIGIELGLPRDASKQIQELKETFRKRKVTLDNFETIDSIPSSINTFEDVYIPQKDGTPYVDIENMDAGTVDTRSKVDELKFVRDSLVAGISIPPAYIGLEENVSQRCISLDTSIPLVSGNSITLEELIDEYENDKLKDRYTYSYNNEEGTIVAGKITWAGKTRLNAQVVKVTLDNDHYEIVTPDHKFMLRDGTYKEAQYLEEGESLMPLYTGITHIKSSKHVPYTCIYHPGKDKWEVAHRAIAKEYNIVEDGDGLQVHHDDFNPMNNTPSNLVGLNNHDHSKVHIEHKHFITTGRVNVREENYVTEDCSVCGEEYIRHIRNSQNTCLSDECIKEMRRINGRKSWENRKNKYNLEDSVKVTCPYCGLEFYRYSSYISDRKVVTCGQSPCYEQGLKDLRSDPKYRNFCSDAGKKGGKKVGKATKGQNKETNPEKFSKRHQTMMERYGTCNGKEVDKIKRGEKEKPNNHKVKSVEWLNEKEDTGCITVESYHNFAVGSGVVIGNSTLSEENSLFARTVVSHQKYLSDHLSNLIYKVYYLTNPDDALTLFENVSIALPSPKNMQFERDAKAMQDAVNVVEALERVDVPKEWAKKKFLTNIDWDDVESFEIDSEIDKKLGEEEEDEEEGGGGMGF